MAFFLERKREKKCLLWNERRQCTWNTTDMMKLSAHGYRECTTAGETMHNGH